MIKIRFGNSRTAIIILNLLVIKFPSFRKDKYIRSFRSRKTFWGFIKEIPSNLYESLLYGLAANISEGILYQYIKGMGLPSFIEPVFSIGILNFQRYRGEEAPTQREINIFYGKLPPEPKELVRKSGSHDPAASNWRKVREKLVLIDYGTNTLDTNWSDFIREATVSEIDTTIHQ